MSKEALQENILSHLRAIDLCLKQHHRMPALILVYSGIDIFSSLMRPIEKEDATRQDFIAWVEKYLHGNENISCDAIDLYAARCAVIHTYTATSSLSRNNKAKEIAYSWGNRTPESLQNIIDTTSIENVAVIHIESLAAALRKGVAQFLQDINNDNEMADRVFKRTRKLFKNQSWKF